MSKAKDPNQGNCPTLSFLMLTCFQLREVGQYFEADSLGTHKMPVQAACGVLSGAVSALATNPLDVIRTRIQVSYLLLLFLTLS